jgi:hypothetical protein
MKPSWRERGNSSGSRPTEIPTRRNEAGIEPKGSSNRDRNPSERRDRGNVGGRAKGATDLTTAADEALLVQKLQVGISWADGGENGNAMAAMEDLARLSRNSLSCNAAPKAVQFLAKGFDRIGGIRNLEEDASDAAKKSERMGVNVREMETFLRAAQAIREKIDSNCLDVHVCVCVCVCV